MTCTACAIAIPFGKDHTFTATDKSVVARYCGACCPRCHYRKAGEE